MHGKISRKSARARFHFEDDTSSDNTHYFVKSKNKWICFCALYYLYKSAGGEALVETWKTILMTLRHDPNIYCQDWHVNCSPILLIRRGRRGPFELLERVMSLKKTALFHGIPAEN